jgi:general secretion pathway protein L
MNLQQEIEFKGLKQFFQWWFSELEFLIPAVIKKVFFRPQIQLNFELIDQQLTVTQLAQQSAAAVVKHFPLTEAGQQGFERWISKLRADNVVHCVFKLNPGQAIEKILILPAAAKDNFKQLIGYELARITPFNPQQVYYDAKILTLPDDPQVKVYLVVVPRKVVDQVMAYLKAWQIPVKQVYYTDASEVTEAVALQCNLLPERRKIPRVSNWQTYAHLGLSALMVLLLATILFFSDVI